jgi:hypothetical protein
MVQEEPEERGGGKDREEAQAKKIGRGIWLIGTT